MTSNRVSTIPLATALAQIDAYIPPTGVDAARFASLKADLKRLLIERDRRGEAVPRPRATHRVAPTTAGKSLSIAPIGTMNAVSNLAATVNPAGTQATLTWTEVLPGDYDNNGVVDIGDLIPVALYYGQRTDSGPDDAHRLVNGDADPEINIWNLGAIAANYAAHIQGYQVWRGHWNGTSTDWEATFRPNPNPANPNWSADRPSPPLVSARPTYTYTDDISSGVSDKNNTRYKVTAYGDGAPGAESNEAAVPATAFSVSGKATISGNGLAGVTLTLAPGGLHATTQADGTYAISGVANGAYTLTPMDTGYIFTPSSVPVTVNGASFLGLDFVATDVYTVSGTVHLTSSSAPLSDVSLTLTPGGLTAMTQVDGTYTITSVRNGNYTVTPYKLGYAILPAHRTFSVATSNVSDLDFSGQAAAGLADTAWPKFRGNSRNTGQSPYVGAQTNTVKWTCLTGSWVESPAIGADGTIYVTSHDQNLYAVSPWDGSVEWRYLVWGTTQLSDQESSPALGADGTIYIGTNDNGLYAIDPVDGSVVWRSAMGSRVRYSPALGADGTVYFENGNLVFAVDPLDGSVKWTCPAGDWISSSPAIGADGTVYIGTDYSVEAINPGDGSVKWECIMNGIVWSSPAVGADGTIYAASWDYGGTYHNKVHAIDPADGSVKWQCPIGQYISSSPAISTDGTVYIGSDNSNIYAINSVNGSVKWKYLAGQQVLSSPAVGADGTVYVGSADHNVYAFNPSDGSVKWQYTTGGVVASSPAIGSDGTVYVGSNGSYVGNLYAFGP